MIAIKTGKKKPHNLADIYHADLQGKQEYKFNKLGEEVRWKRLNVDQKMFYFVSKSIVGKDEYEMGFSVIDLFIKYSTGIVTMGDNFIIDFSRDILRKRIDNFLTENITEENLKSNYNLGKNYARWVIKNKNKITCDYEKIVSLSYRPLDCRYTYFDNKLVWRPRTKIMNNFILGNNIGLVTARSNKNPNPDHFFMSKCITEAKLGESSTQSYVFPLFLYEEDGSRTPNLRREIVNKIEKIVGKTSPENILDYIYAVLYSPSYRKKYKEFLRIDFPRVPYPKGSKSFKELVVLGGELRSLHLFESPKLSKFISTYPITGTDTIEKIEYKDGNIFINSDQYFGKVPDIAWNFYIGGYQPAQKWLKDRKGITLSDEDIEYYQKMTVVLSETEEIMKTVDLKMK